MSNSVHVAVICEGKTEQIFVESIIAPYFSGRNIHFIAIQITKPGQKGGDVKFARLCNDLRVLLNQRHWHCVTTFLDFYGLKGHWPNYEEAKGKQKPEKKHAMLSRAVKKEVEAKFSELDVERRFVPFFVMHETEALYFSCPESMASILKIKEEKVQAILKECGSPEAINHKKETAPSHRIVALIDGKSFKKTTTGITIAQKVGLQKMRDNCPIFNQWIESFEQFSTFS